MNLCVYEKLKTVVEVGLEFITQVAIITSEILLSRELSIILDAEPVARFLRLYGIFISNRVNSCKL